MTWHEYNTARYSSTAASHAIKPTKLLGFSLYSDFPQYSSLANAIRVISMYLTTKGRYAVTAMIDLAMNQHNGPVTLKSISANQGISLPYLEQLFSKMRRSNLVVGTRGPGGGYVIAKAVNQISIADIVVAVDEPLDITECAGQKNCHAGKRCLSHGLWSELSDQLYNFLAGIRLGQLMRQSGIEHELADEQLAHHVGLPVLDKSLKQNNF